MRKTVCTFLISLLIISFANAQVTSCKKGHCLRGDRGYVNFTIGPSIPLGSFADNDIKNKDAGFASTGSKIGLNGGYNVTDKVNLIGSLFYSVNGYDETSLKNKLALENPGTTWDTYGRSWDIYGFMVGATYSYPFRNKFVGDVRLQTGIMHSSLPEMVISSNNGLKITESSRAATSFVYQISVGGHYPLGRLLDITGSLEYLSSSPTFNNINRVSNLPSGTPGSVTGTGVTSYNHNINILALDIGLRVKF
jgi:hypothetical protein